MWGRPKRRTIPTRRQRTEKLLKRRTFEVRRHGSVLFMLSAVARLFCVGQMT
jgi:hypothetical protein